MYFDLSAAIAPVAASLRPRILDIRRWALWEGRRVDADVVALIVAGKMWLRDEPLDLWTRIGVYGTLYSYVPNWCSLRRVMVPSSAST